LLRSVAAASAAATLMLGWQRGADRSAWRAGPHRRTQRWCAYLNWFRT